MVAGMGDLLPGRRVKNHLLSTENKVDCLWVFFIYKFIFFLENSELHLDQTYQGIIHIHHL